MKKIIFSAVMLLLSAVLAVVSVFAWFAVQDSVRAGLSDTPIEHGFASSATVTYYNAEADGAGGYIPGDRMADADRMPTFSTDGQNPIIAKIDFVYRAAADFIMTTRVTCTSASFMTVAKGENGQAEIGNAFLSNISEFTFLNRSGDRFTANGEALAFYVNDKKTTSIAKDMAFTRADGDIYTVYMLIDYNRAALSRFYFLLLQQGIASQGTVYEFESDLSIGFVRGGAQ